MPTSSLTALLASRSTPTRGEKGSESAAKRAVLQRAACSCGEGVARVPAELIYRLRRTNRGTRSGAPFAAMAMTLAMTTADFSGRRAM